jgi:hypothetical protein
VASGRGLQDHQILGHPARVIFWRFPVQMENRQKMLLRRGLFNAARETNPLIAKAGHLIIPGWNKK